MDETRPRAAATLVLLRNGREGPEVLLTTRPDHLRFMGGAMVFPGGAIAPADRDPHWLDACQFDPALLSGSSHDAVAALAPYVCAIRESFEEVGLLLADGPVGYLERAHAEDAGWFLDRCLRLGIRLRADLLVQAGRWVTPLGSPIRFDTHFFMTEAPLEWEPDPDPSEVASFAWLTAEEALVGALERRHLMAPPTIETLQQLRGHADVASILESLRDNAGSNTGSERLSPLVQRVVAPNPGLMTGPGTNTYIVGNDPAVVIDPAVPVDSYLNAIVNAAGDVALILVTHRHPDHVGGIAKLVARTGAEVRAFGSERAGSVDVTSLTDEETIEVGDVRLVALHTPGHASDHVCFFMSGAASLFAGDNILGQGTAVIAPPDGDMGQYLKSLERLNALQISRIYPGHFDPLDGGNAVIDQYLAHRAERGRAIVTAIANGATTLEAIVEAVYIDTPKELHPIAVYQVEAQLQLLAESGQVRKSGNRWET
jgi:glyoxylase-like metal-dependent hydrolase (beta-lactamase superfamily II)/8-oxo-dGTP pyrophosphatase MutT (NUDIX family)